MKPTTIISAFTGAALGLGTVAGAQALSSRVNAVREGEVRMSFPLRPGVCGRGNNVWYSGRSSYNNDGDRRSRDVEYDIDCDAGPGRLVIVRREGETTDLRFYVGGRWRTSSTATDLGSVGAHSATDTSSGSPRRTMGRWAGRRFSPRRSWTASSSGRCSCASRGTTRAREASVKGRRSGLGSSLKSQRHVA